jgi:hypothetical protein
MKEIQGFGDVIHATLGTSGTSNETVGIEGMYHVECRDSEGNLKWEQSFPNLVVAVGKQLLLNTVLRTSGTYGPTVGPFLGLIVGSPTPTFAATDTMGTHPGWTEFTNYTVGSAVRGTVVFPSTATSTGSSPSNITSLIANLITYTITGAGGSVGGCFLVTGTGAVSTHLDNNGTLYSAGAFGSPRVTVAGDTIAVTYTATATS